MSRKYPTIIPGLRSPADKINGLVCFGRMLDKIRLHAKGQRPAAWREMRGSAAGPNTFDVRGCRKNITATAKP